MPQRCSQGASVEGANEILLGPIIGKMLPERQILLRAVNDDFRRAETSWPLLGYPCDGKRCTSDENIVSEFLRIYILLKSVFDQMSCKKCGSAGKKVGHLVSMEVGA